MTEPPRTARPLADVLSPTVALAAVVLALGLLLSAAVVGCGVPIDSDPRAISRTSVDPDLDASRQTPTTSDSPGAPEVSAYFMRGDVLEAVDFRVEGRPTIEDALAFATGEPPSGLTTSIPTGTSILTVTAEGAVAVIDLTGDINDISGQGQKQAYAQLAFTAFSFSEISEVRFLVDGKPVDAPTDNGNRASIRVIDYDELRPTT